MIAALIKRLGSRYMPKNAVHFSELPPNKQEAMLARAPILREKHFDWLALGGIARTDTTWWVPFPPPKVRGTAPEVQFIADDGSIHVYCQPIPPPGTWFETEGSSPGVVGYRAETGPDGEVNRRGARFDDVDGYMTFPSFRAGSLTSFLGELFGRAT